MLDFLGIGAQKAGTTWLYEMLCQHPEITFPAGKEIHYWNVRYRTESLNWYCDLFAGQPGTRQGEITPAYALLPRAHIRQIHELNPALRLIFIIRNPLERAWSAALMALERAEMTIDEASDQWFIDHFHSAGSLNRGDYQSSIETWRSVFPADQLLILRYEQIKNEPLQLLQQCCRHLGVDPSRKWAAEALQRRVFAGHGQPLRPSLLPILKNLYHDKIERLADYLGEDLQEWLADAA